METPLEELIAGLDGLYEKATKGPWEADDEASIYAPVSVNFAIAHTGGKNWQERDSNAALIVALVNSYPRLRAHLKGRDEVIEEVLAMIRRECSVDDNGDPVSAQPEDEWENGLAAGTRMTYRMVEELRALRNAAPAAEGNVVQQELDEAVSHIRAMRLTALALISQVCGRAGTTAGNQIATDLNSVVKRAQDWLITHESKQPKPQPKVPRTTHG